MFDAQHDQAHVEIENVGVAAGHCVDAREVAQAAQVGAQADSRPSLEILARCDESCAEFVLCGHVELVALCVNLSTFVRERDPDHRIVLGRAKNNADRRGFPVAPLKAVVVVHVHLHLAEILMGQLAKLEIHQHEATQESVIENQVDVEVVALERDTLLPADEAEALAQLEKEGTQSIHDGPLEIALMPLRSLLKVKEFENHRILEDILGSSYELTSLGQVQDFRPVSVPDQAFEKKSAALSLKSACAQ